MRFIILLVCLNSYAFCNEKCVIYYNEPTGSLIKEFPNCEWRPLSDFYFLEKSFLGPLEEGIHCAIENEDKIVKIDILHCSANSIGLPKLAYFNKLFLRCEELGPPPENKVNRRWFEEKEVFEECVGI